jgi:GxxExxY protein
MLSQGMEDQSKQDRIRLLCDIARQTAFAVHSFLGHGHLEKVYEAAMFHRLAKDGLKVQRQYPIAVFDEDGTELGTYAADLLMEDKLIVELKASKTLAAEHFAQVLGYLRASRREHGRLINFGSFQFEIRKIALSPLT